MHVIEQIVALLRADTDIAAIVGDRIYADNPPQDTLKPSIELYLVSDDQDTTIDRCTIELGVMLIQINCLGNSRSQAHDLSTKVRRGILHYTSNDPDQKIQDVNISSGSRWDVIRPLDGSDSYTYECQNDYNVPYTFTI